MQLEVLQRKENPLLKRVEVTFKATHKAEPTPTRDALRAFLAKELKATKDIVVIDYQASTRRKRKRETKRRRTRSLKARRKRRSDGRSEEGERHGRPQAEVLQD